MQGRAPLTPEQRDVAGTAFRVAAYRMQCIKAGVSGHEIDRRIGLARLPQLMMLVGPGGSGKSNTVDTLGDELERAGHGYVAITAYTGVAASAFGAPTLLKLLGFGRKQTKTPPPCDAQVHRQKLERWVTECGVTMSDVACFVVDEASFIGVDLLGRTCHAVAQLEGLENIHVGGIPMILTGDCFQKDPCAAEPFYKTLVNDAVNDQGGSKDPNSATARGLRLLKRSRKFELTRIMRAMSDPGFIAHPSQMRDTSIAKPVNKALVKNVARPVTQADIANDANWLLAPLGVLSQLERDHMNERRLHQWCRIFGLPLVRWRIPLDTPVALQNVPTDKLYAEEVNLWCYYARGAPLRTSSPRSAPATIG
ncbi:hypothetical protein M885DRAFT_590976 [Pelagophyceae sp. CCMP2097]|nr:hypothetical protein M885DRAFT_590976 [Pelagophyceae sp. CCMP2097]